ncbi:LysR family transcriptional regulator [Microvirga sp. HBU67558]|uniref:LysR substrate-binding domain-containing protein n=1 Tax=Microvirga TaxID=186650 RepID=UPI001B3805BF|nr:MULTISPECIES: LysR substrate-binding domain-containing protein [unclassified Microvirga]MBQ0822706.1 LysR family transcriptional regulator [Microvirga sp. HBU67558]
MSHSSTPLPPLDALRAFEAAARLGSFSAAANDLHLTHGAISRQVAKLEHWLGERLFDRQARGVALTPQGQRLHQRTSEAFALIADSSDRWIERRGAAIVRLTSIPSVSSLWLMPRLKAFEDGDPCLRIEFVVEHRNIDLEAEGIDLAIRCGRGTLPGRMSVRLFEEQCFPIASPALADALGAGAPERLLDYPLVHDSDASAWRAWFAAQGMDYRPRPQDRRFEDYNLVLDAAAHGLGIALARPPLAGDALRTGRVAAVDSRMVVNPVSYWLDRTPSRLRPSAAELARRIMAEAGVNGADARTFLSA